MFVTPAYIGARLMLMPSAPLRAAQAQQQRCAPRNRADITRPAAREQQKSALAPPERQR